MIMRMHEKHEILVGSTPAGDRSMSVEGLVSSLMKYRKARHLRGTNRPFGGRRTWSLDVSASILNYMLHHISISSVLPCS